MLSCGSLYRQRNKISRLNRGSSRHGPSQQEAAASPLCGEGPHVFQGRAVLGEERELGSPCAVQSGARKSMEVHAGGGYTCFTGYLLQGLRLRRREHWVCPWAPCHRGGGQAVLAPWPLCPLRLPSVDTHSGSAGPILKPSCALWDKELAFPINFPPPFSPSLLFSLPPPLLPSLPVQSLHVALGFPSSLPLQLPGSFSCCTSVVTQLPFRARLIKISAAQTQGVWTPFFIAKHSALAGPCAGSPLPIYLLILKYL